MAQYESNYTGSQIDTAVLKITNASSNLTYLGCGIGTCSTAAATAAKVVTLKNYERVTNGIIAVTFTNDVPANATLNINSKGAKPIFYKGSAITADTIKAGDTVMFSYDGTNYVVISLGGAIPYIGENGNWFVGDTDTTVKAQGPQGPQGAQGPLGVQGPQGPQGPAGTTIHTALFSGTTSGNGNVLNNWGRPIMILGVCCISHPDTYLCIPYVNSSDRSSWRIHLMNDLQSHTVASNVAVILSISYIEV